MLYMSPEQGTKNCFADVIVAKGMQLKSNMLF